jgi:hypothetical protein
MLPELQTNETQFAGLTREYSSADDVMSFEETARLLRNQKLMPGDMANDSVEVLR